MCLCNIATLSESYKLKSIQSPSKYQKQANSELETTGEFYKGSDAADNHLCLTETNPVFIEVFPFFSGKDRDLYFILNLILFSATIHFYHMIVTFIDNNQNYLIGCGRLNAMPQDISGKGSLQCDKLRILR